MLSTTLTYPCWLHSYLPLSQSMLVTPMTCLCRSRSWLRSWLVLVAWRTMLAASLNYLFGWPSWLTCPVFHAMLATPLICSCWPCWHRPRRSLLSKAMFDTPLTYPCCRPCWLGGLAGRPGTNTCSSTRWRSSHRSCTLAAHRYRGRRGPRLSLRNVVALRGTQYL